jgi:phospholipid/cholesterol/gamma-HCH transport system substrate-binding protein
MNTTREILVGAVILAGITVAVLGSLWLKGSTFGRGTTPIDVLVPEVGQLAEGNQVKFRGVPVGRVTSFDVEPHGQAVRVHLRLDRELELPLDAGAVISPESLFGEWQVELVSRSRVNFEFLELPDASLTPDSTGVVVLPGFAMPDITRLTAAANDISQNLAVLTNRVDRAFSEETAENIRLAIENISEASSNIRVLIDQQASVFAEVSREVEIAASEISAAAASAGQVLQKTDAIMASGQIDSVISASTRIASNIEQLSGNMALATQDLGGTLARADSALSRVDRLAARVERGDGLLGQLMGDTVLVARAGSVLNELDQLLADLRENPKRYVRLSIF